MYIEDAKLLTKLGKRVERKTNTNNMEETYKTIDYEWLTRPTDDPFADAISNLITLKK